MHLMIGFGLSFQMPIVLMILARLGVMQVAWLKRNRRYAVVIIVILAAILTPPDVFSQIGLASILYALYEISILGCKLVTKTGDKNDI
jgi:sec-independent protein translocase protein TatC